MTPFKPLAPQALGSVSRAFYDEATRPSMRRSSIPGPSYVGALDTRTGTTRRLADVKGAMLFKVASFAFDPASGTAFFTNDNKMFRDLMAVDVKTGESRMLLEDARTRLVFNRSDRSLLGVRHLNGLRRWCAFLSLHRLQPGPHLSLRRGDVRPRHRPDGSSSPRRWRDQRRPVPARSSAKVLGGDVKPMSEHAFGQAVPESFVSRDGRHLYGSSYYTGVSNIFRYEVANGEVEAVSNAESGFFRPIPLGDGSLVVFHYTGAGFVPATIDPKPIKDVSAIKFLGAEVAARHPVVTTWQVPPPGTVDEQSLIVARGPYFPLRTMGLRNAYPVLQGYKDSFGLGYHAQIEDTLRFASLGITVAYTPDGKLASDERGHVDLKYRYIDWRAGASWNRSDFYDMFGPTKLSRKGYAANVGYEPFLIFDEPRKLQLKSDIAYYGKLDTLPDFQNVQTNVERLITAEVGLYYTFVHKSLGAVDDEKGVNWELVASANHANGKTVPQFAAASTSVALPLPNSSVWLRSAGGYSRGDRNDPLRRSTSRLRQQLRRQPLDQALPRVLLVPGLRAERDRRADVRPRDPRVERAADRLRERRHARLLPDVAASGGVRFGALDRSGALGIPQALRQRGIAARPALHDPALVGNDPVRRLRGRLPGQQARGRRVDGVAEDPVSGSNARDG